MLLAACSAEEDTDTEEITGKISGNPDFFNRLLLMKEDELTGDAVRDTPDRHQRESYQTEAYHLFLTDETEIKVQDETYSFHHYTETDDLDRLFHPNQTVTVTTAEPIEPRKTELDRYLTYNPAFLPVYEAQTLELEPYALEDFFTYHMPVKENKYQILTLNISGSGEIRAGTDLEGVLPHLESGELADWDTIAVGEDNPFYDKVTDGPVHAILTDGEILLYTEDQDEIIEFFETR